MHHEIQGGKVAAALPAAVRLSNPPFEAMSNHGVTDLSAGGNPQSWPTFGVGGEI
jgi:hypothetical protein